MAFRPVLALVFILLGVLILSACDVQTPPPPTLQPLPTQDNPGPGSGTTLTYTTTGGIEGVNRTLYITPEGFATLIDRGQTFGPVTLPQQRVVDIKAKLREVNFQSLNEHYGKGNVEDDFESTLLVVEGSTSKSVTVEEVGGKEVTPEAVKDLFALMSKVTEDVRGIASVTPTVITGSYRGTINFKSTREVNGQNWEMTITEDGKAAVSDGGQPLGTLQLPSEQMERLRSLLELANFYNLRVYYGSGSPGTNERVDTITLIASGRTKVVTVERSAGFREGTLEMRNLFQAFIDTYAGARAQLVATPGATP